MTVKFIPGELVCRGKDSSYAQFSTITNGIGHVIEGENKHVGNITSQDVALIIATYPYKFRGEDAEEALIMTSSGILGWIYVEALVRLDEREES